MSGSRVLIDKTKARSWAGGGGGGGGDLYALLMRFSTLIEKKNRFSHTSYLTSLSHSRTHTHTHTRMHTNRKQSQQTLAFSCVHLLSLGALYCLLVSRCCTKSCVTPPSQQRVKCDFFCRPCEELFCVGCAPCLFVCFSFPILWG